MPRILGEAKRNGPAGGGVAVYIGIAGDPSYIKDPEPLALLTDLGVTHLKTKWALRNSVDSTRAFGDRCAELGLEWIPDLKPPPNAEGDTPYFAMMKASSPLGARLRKEERFVALADDAAVRAEQQREEEQRGRRLDPDEVFAIRERLMTAQTRAITIAACDIVLQEFREEVAVFSEATRGAFRHVEFWGEWGCPTVTQAPNAQIDYASMFVSFAEGMRQGSPDIQVWMGGNGVHLSLEMLKALIMPVMVDPRAYMRTPNGIGEHFDVYNMHHYYHTRWVPGQTLPNGKTADETYGLEAVIEAYDAAFAEARNLLVLSHRQPFASTEWGYPTVQHRAEAGPLVSKCYTPGILPVPEDVAPLWYDRSFECFERNGFGVICVYDLHDHTKPDGDVTYWGHHCGICDGEWQPKPQYKTVQEWAWKGRQKGDTYWYACS